MEKCLSNSFHTISKNNGENIRASFCGYFNQLKHFGDEKQTMFFLKKKGYHTISIYENCMTSIFLMATLKSFPIKIEIAPIFFSTAKLTLYSNKQFLKTKNLHASFSFLSG